jgi:hypothetical protein
LPSLKILPTTEDSGVHRIFRNKCFTVIRTLADTIG